MLIFDLVVFPDVDMATYPPCDPAIDKEPSVIMQKSVTLFKLLWNKMINFHVNAKYFLCVFLRIKLFPVVSIGQWPEVLEPQDFLP